MNQQKLFLADKGASMRVHYMLLWIVDMELNLRTSAPVSPSQS